MATFVTSDAHGHLRALDRALELAAPGPDDTVYVLGDMVDRGPDPVGVLRLVHGLPRARVLLGNHEDMLLTALATGEQLDLLTWEMNGGSSIRFQVRVAASNDTYSVSSTPPAAPRATPV